MTSCQAYSSSGESKGEVELPEALFGLEPNESVMYEAVKNYLSNQRRGTASTKTRGECRGGGRKPYRQKHTGWARQGSIRSPILVGGGVAFGPKPRSYSYSTNRKVRRLALKSALSLRAKEGRVLVVELPQFQAPKTKSMMAILKALGVAEKRCLLLVRELDEKVHKSGRNIESLTLKLAASVNAHDVLANEFLLLSEGSLEKLGEVFS